MKTIRQFKLLSVLGLLFCLAIAPINSYAANTSSTGCSANTQTEDISKCELLADYGEEPIDD